MRICGFEVALLGEPLRLTDLGGIGGGLLVVVGGVLVAVSYRPCRVKPGNFG